MYDVKAITLRSLESQFIICVQCLNEKNNPETLSELGLILFH